MRLLKKLELPELLIVSGVICTFFGAVGIYVKDSIDTNFSHGHLRAGHACSHTNRSQARVIHSEDLRVIHAPPVVALVPHAASPAAAAAIHPPLSSKALSCTLAGEALYKPAINTTALEPR